MSHYSTAPLTAADYSLEAHTPTEMASYAPSYRSSPVQSVSSARSWITVPCQNPSAAPCHRSLHVCAVHKDSMYIFGGYDGSNRVNDFFEYNFKRKVWSQVLAIGIPPTPRDRHVAVVYKDSFYVFAGFDGSSRVNDFIEFNFNTQKWSPVAVASGMPPSPRHSHAAVVYDKSLFCFGGYDGSYRNDFYEFNFETCVWSQVAATGRFPRPRYRASLVTHKSTCILFGGHDGSRHLNDVHVFNFSLRSWSMLLVEGPAPIPRDSHVAVTHGNSMYIFGGSTGSAMNDFHELNLENNVWQLMAFNGPPPGQRFCHVGCVYDDSLAIFGGYDGSSRLNDFKEFRFGEEIELDIPPPCLVDDLRDLVNNQIMSDITFIVEGVPIYAHKILCLRCSYFKAMLTGEMRESRAREVEIPDVRKGIFLAFLEYLYTDHVNVDVDTAMELFVTADRYGVDRLKKICESKMLSSLCIENAASILHAADMHSATILRDRCIAFMLNNFDAVTKTNAFEEMGRTNVDLVFELLKRPGVMEKSVLDNNTRTPLFQQTSAHSGKMSSGLKTQDEENEVLYVSFNQDATCISVGTRSGFFIYSCEPFGRSFHEASGGIGIAQMLFSTSLVVLVGAGEQPAFSPRRLRVWNTKTNAAICDLNFVTAVLSVQLNRQRLVVVLERKIYIFDINTMQVLNTIDTAPNPKALCVLSPSDNGHLAFPTGTVAGEIVLYDANNLSVLNAIQAHRGTPVALAFNIMGTLLATASETGTILRVFSVPNGKKQLTFRRGSYPAQIYCLAFNASSTLLCCSSDTGTIHIFSLTGAEGAGSFAIPPVPSLASLSLSEAAAKKARSSSDAVLGAVGSYMPASVSRIAEGTRDFAFARLRTARVPNLCAIHGPEEGSSKAKLLVATIDGFFYQYVFDAALGGECQLERENLLRDSSSEEITATYLT